MDFKSQLTVALPSLIGASGLGVFLALQGHGVWSLVYMNLLQALLSSIFFWIKAGWKPSFIINTTKLKYHFNFGYKLSLANLISTVYDYAYHIIIGRMFSVSQLGYYTRADSMKQLPVANISVALNKVTFPLFASIQNDDIKLKLVYRKLMQQVLFWIAPVLVIAGVLAEPLFRFLLTEKWLPSVPIFQILCIVGIMYPLHSYNINILNVKGRSDLVLRLEIIKKIIITIGILFSIKYGLFGLLWMQVILNVLSFAINTFYSGKLINYPLKEQVQDLIPILAISLITGVITYFLVYELSSFFTTDLIILVLGSVFGLSVYLFISYIIKINALLDFKLLVLKR